MKRQEYKKLQLQLDKLILKFAIDNNIEERVLLKMLLSNANAWTVRFNEEGAIR